MNRTSEDQMYLQDERILTGFKLIDTISYANLNMIIFSRCFILFDDRLPFFQKLLKLLDLMSEKVYYADFSYNNLTLV
jgi:hypothetical protein